jgi:succinate-semialdehyde dehydrogenase / glutarate-semialdehyde dehydrogenase
MIDSLVKVDNTIDGVFINGSWVHTDEYFEVFNPANEEVIARVSRAKVDNVYEAISASKLALGFWKKLKPFERNKYILGIIDTLEVNKKSLAEIITLEQGKPLHEAISEIEKCCDYIKWFTEENLRINDYSLYSTSPNTEINVKYEPIGVVAAITPWNLPVGSIIRKIIPALCVGCTVILKPSSQTPLSAIKLVQLVSDYLPNGILNLISTNQDEIVGEILSSHEDIDLLTFTGSTETGQKIIRNSSSSVKKLILELGGSAPFIVFKDCDIDKTIESIINAKFRNAGQTCISVNRLYIEKGIEDTFINKLVAKVKKIKVGDGFKSGVEMGPLINQRAINKVEEHVTDAVLKGAKVITGGNRIKRKGFFYEPTIITNVKLNMKVMQEETFGPVLPIAYFEDHKQLIEDINRNKYGLCAYIYTKSQKTAKKMVDGLDFGIISVNNERPTQVSVPFGGFKNSGFGKESGREGLLEFLRLKSVYFDDLHS